MRQEGYLISCQANALSTHREKWATELAKNLQHLTVEVRAFVQNTELGESG